MTNTLTMGAGKGADETTAATEPVRRPGPLPSKEWRVAPGDPTCVFTGDIATPIKFFSKERAAMVVAAVNAYRSAPEPPVECPHCNELIDERDRAQDALQETHIALGGDGEWTGKLPPQPAPDSGDLHLDVPELASERMAELERLRAAQPPAELWGDGTREMLIELRDWMRAKMPCNAGACCSELRGWIEKVDKHITHHAPAASSQPPGDLQVGDHVRLRGGDYVRVVKSRFTSYMVSAYNDRGEVEIREQDLMPPEHENCTECLKDRPGLNRGESR